MEFKTRYKQLNTAQKKAVDTVEGPVMVVAGPGTGKTELLAMRVANILEKTDTLPENILCLTFTESGAEAMRERLVAIIGQDGYKVAVHTFHSFGSEVINQNGEFFYQGASFRPADELSSREILGELFDELDYTNPLVSKMNGEYTHLSDTLRAISELKKSGLTSSELLQVLEANDEAMDTLEKQLQNVFSRRISVTSISLLIPVAQNAAELDIPLLPLDIVPLGNVIATSLAHAIDQAQADDSTKPITAWKNSWLEKDSSGSLVFKDRKRQVKLRAVAALYDAYLARMQEAALYDFDDMILQLVHTMETQPDLKYNLQEKHQYILVDEFQDTNLAQARILHNLTDNPVNEGKPNILIVGDDDQAIYAFQGADVSNILNFREDYSKAELIVLTENYRSAGPILQASRGVIVQGQDRLENYHEELNKTLKPQKDAKGAVRLLESPSTRHEREWLVSEIGSLIQKGTDPSDIAVLTRRHDDIVKLLPYFHDAGIAVRYERQDNVLDNEVVRALEDLALLILAMKHRRLDEANGLLPEVLAHPAWGIPAEELWQLSLEAYSSRQLWLEVMPKFKSLGSIATWLHETVKLVAHTPLERILDRLIGYDEEKATTDEMRSPYYDYYFSDTDAPGYLDYLEALRTIRQKFREYQPHDIPTLESFIEYIRLHRTANIPILRSRQPGSETAVNLMTAHKAKGLEFGTVYITGAIDKLWGVSARSRSRLISYPANLPLTINGASLEERLRLFFVAMTRAKHTLIISYAQTDDNDKECLPLGALLPLDLATEHAELGKKSDTTIKSLEREWYGHLTEPITKPMHEVLKPFLDRYKLSVTHLNNFIDVTRGGPGHFLLANLLHFPSSMSAAAAYGSAIHSTLQSAHIHLTTHGELKPLEDVLRDFEKVLNVRYLSPGEFEEYLARGSDVLHAFLAARGSSFRPSQKAELSFGSQHVLLGNARLTGNLDLVDIDTKQKLIHVTDYKTGKAPLSWQGKTDFEKIKLHKYKQQLMFYKLLVEHSRDYGNYKVDTASLEFVEPLANGDIIVHDLQFTDDQLERFEKLIAAVWHHIQDFNLPDTSGYEQSYKGVLAFEEDLLSGNA